MDEPLPKFDGICVRDLLDAHYVLAPLSRLLATDARSIEAVRSLDDLWSCAPLLHIDDVVSALARALSIPPERARSILRALTFDSTTRDEPWLKPFVQIDGPWLAVFVEALRTPNLLWAIDSWLLQGGFAMTERGPAFEAHVRTDLSHSLLLDDSEIVPRAMRFLVDDREEEIDFIARVGSTILIGEVKCSVFPAEPYQVRTYAETLEEGANQAARKAAFVAEHFIKFIEQAGMKRIEGSPQVVPLVISNLPLGPAIPSSAVAVTDLMILRKYLSSGKLARFGTLNPDGSTTSLEEVVLHSTAVEAEERLTAYLLDPPQIQLLKSVTCSSRRPIAFFEGERPAAFVVVRTEPFDEMRLIAGRLAAKSTSTIAPDSA